MRPMSAVRVRARYVGQIAVDLGRRTEQYLFPGPVSIDSLLRQIVSRHGRDCESVFYSRDGRAVALAILNGRAAGSEEILTDGQTVTLVPMVAGG